MTGKEYGRCERNFCEDDNDKCQVGPQRGSCRWLTEYPINLIDKVKLLYPKKKENQDEISHRYIYIPYQFDIVVKNILLAFANRHQQ